MPAPEQSRRLDIIVLIIFFVFAVLATVALLTDGPVSAAVLPIGLFALWRYLWWMTHLARAILFLKLRFPRLRYKAERDVNAREVSHIYAVVASYNIPKQHFAAVYRALFANAIEAKIQ